VIAREVDFPPVWLAGFAAIGALAGRIYPLSYPHLPVLGAAMVGFALALMAAAAAQMLWARTTILPRQIPARLVTGGVFRFSRNPIYLADALLLVGLYFFWQALIALPLVALFMHLIYRRFIRGEEAAMLHAFGAEFEDYRRRTRRWL